MSWEQHITEPACVPQVVTDLIDARAGLSPDSIAYRFCSDGELDTKTITYRELRARARRIARRLSREVKIGDRVIVALPPGLDFIAYFFGGLYAGAIVVPAYPPIRLRNRRSIERFARVVKDSGATAVLTTPTLASGLRNNRADVAFPSSLCVLDCGQIECSIEDLGDVELPRARPEDPAFLQYTSGSTSLPRGVVLTNANLLYNLKIIADLFGSTKDSVGVIWLPPYHDMGLIGGILQPLFAGFPVTLFSPFRFAQRPIRWLEAISRWKGTISGGPNFAYELCIRNTSDDERATLDLSSWQIAFNGAETVRSETLEQFAKMFRPCGFRREAIFPCYGLAEATLLVTGRNKSHASSPEPFRSVVLPEGSSAVEARRGAKLVGVGQAAPGTRVVIVDPETRHQVVDRNIGEIWVAAPGVGAGYWNRPIETEHTFGARLTDSGEGPFLRTGDLGFLDSGDLFVTGRLKDVIIIRGLKYWPQDIESIAESVDPCVRAAASFTEGEGSASSLIVIVEWEGDADPDLFRKVETAIRTAIAEELDLRVDRVAVVAPGTIPRTTSGKIQRHLCRGCLEMQDAEAPPASHRLAMREGNAAAEP